MVRKNILILTVLLSVLGIFNPNVSWADQHSEHEEEGGVNMKNQIFGHVNDSHSWHIFSTAEGHDAKHFSIPLPVMVYNIDAGKFDFFSSSKFEHGHASHAGYTEQQEGLKSGKLAREDGAKFFDFSITKNVLAMLIAIAFMLWLFLSIAKKYKSGQGATSAPKGIQNAVESVIQFVREQIAEPCLSKKNVKKFLPYLLTLFFFIWINNMFGLIPIFPGGASFTGNFAVTVALALIFFVIMLLSSKKGYWMHMLNPPGVPFGIKLLLVPIEIVSNLLIKPAALAIRLFANMFAGHTIILSIILLVSIFAGLAKVAGVVFLPVSIGFTIFMFCLELLVAAIQAFIFTNLAAVFLGEAVAEHDDHH